MSPERDSVNDPMRYADLRLTVGITEGPYVLPDDRFAFTQQRADDGIAARPGRKRKTTSTTPPGSSDLLINTT